MQLLFLYQIFYRMDRSQFIRMSSGWITNTSSVGKDMRESRQFGLLSCDAKVYERWDLED